MSYQNRLKISLVKKVEFMKLRYEKCMASTVFKEPTRKINENYIIIDRYVKSLENSIISKLEEKKTKYVELIGKLDAYSPLKTLSRGYSITRKRRKNCQKCKRIKRRRYCRN